MNCVTVRCVSIIPFIYENKSTLTVLGAAAFYDAFFTFSLTSIVPLHFSANYFGLVFKKEVGLSLLNFRKAG